MMLQICLWITFLWSIRPSSGKIKLGWPRYLCGYGIRHASSLFNQTFRKITRLLLFSSDPPYCPVHDWPHFAIVVLEKKYIAITEPYTIRFYIPGAAWYATENTTVRCTKIVLHACLASAQRPSKCAARARPAILLVPATARPVSATCLAVNRACRPGGHYWH